MEFVPAIIRRIARAWPEERNSTKFQGANLCPFLSLSGADFRLAQGSCDPVRFTKPQTVFSMTVPRWNVLYSESITITGNGRPDRAASTAFLLRTFFHRS